MLSTHSSMIVPTTAAKTRRSDKVNRLVGKAHTSMKQAIRMYSQKDIEGCLLFLEHAFEMLLKAYIFDDTSNIETAAAGFTYKFQHCIDMCLNKRAARARAISPISKKREEQPATFSKTDAATRKKVSTSYPLARPIISDADAGRVMMMIARLRNMAQHDVCLISYELLSYVVAGAVPVFCIITKTCFPNEKFVPSTSQMPHLQGTLFDVVLADLKSISENPNEESRVAMLSVYKDVDRTLGEWDLSGQAGQTYSIKNNDEIIRRLRSGADWRVLLPYVSSLSYDQSREIPLYTDAVFDRKAAYPYSLPGLVSAMYNQHIDVSKDSLRKLSGMLAENDDIQKYVHFTYEGGKGPKVFWYNLEALKVFVDVIAKAKKQRPDEWLRWIVLERRREKARRNLQQTEEEAESKINAAKLDVKQVDAEIEAL